MLEILSQNFLSLIPAETAHKIAKWAMKRKWFALGVYHTIESETELFGVKLPNPFGIAAGFDKNAELQDVVQDYGFGFIELGSFTYLGGEGNKNKKIRRLADGSLFNNLGLNCSPAHEVVERLKKSQSQKS